MPRRRARRAQAALGVPADKEWIRKSEPVRKALAGEVMRSVAHLFPDLLARLPVLLYQGATDAQDGPATNEPWIRALAWPGQRGFDRAERRLWRMPAELVRFPTLALLAGVFPSAQSSSCSCGVMCIVCI